MKTTDQYCFGASRTSCATALDAWQQSNCRRCEKARFFNTATGRMPKYYCAIQSQIEQQAATGEPVNVRTYDAVHGRDTCAFIRAISQDVQPVETGFAQGKTIAIPVKQEHTDAGQAATDMVKEINRRRIDEIGRKIMSGETPANDEQALRKRIAADVKERLQTFTWEEQKNIAYVPLVMQIVAWKYAFDVKQYAADNRISVMKKMSRAIADMHGRWSDMICRDLDASHMRRLEIAADEWMADTTNDRFILRIQVTNEFLRQYADMPHMDMFVLATCCRLMATFVQSYQHDIDMMVASRMNRPFRNIRWPHMEALCLLMDGVLQNCGIEQTKMIDDCLRVMRNRLEKIKWIQEQE